MKVPVHLGWVLLSADLEVDKFEVTLDVLNLCIIALLWKKRGVFSFSRGKYHKIPLYQREVWIGMVIIY